MGERVNEKQARRNCVVSRVTALLSHVLAAGVEGRCSADQFRVAINPRIHGFSAKTEEDPFSPDFCGRQQLRGDLDRGATKPC